MSSPNHIPQESESRDSELVDAIDTAIRSGLRLEEGDIKGRLSTERQREIMVAQKRLTQLADLLHKPNQSPDLQEEILLACEKVRALVDIVCDELRVPRKTA